MVINHETRHLVRWSRVDPPAEPSQGGKSCACESQGRQGRREDLEREKELSNTVEKCCFHIRNLGFNMKTWDFI